MKNESDLLISSNEPVSNIIQKLNTSDLKILLIRENKKIIGIFTEGDFRKAVLNGIDISKPVKNFINKNFKFLNKNYNKQKVINFFKKNKKIHVLPVLSDDKTLLKILTRNDFFKKKNNQISNTSVVIMAGGKGTRLQPFTEILPKPLLPLEGTTLLDKIIHQFASIGHKDFFVTLNNKKDLIKSYIKENLKKFKINIIEEKKYLGTIGSLKLINKNLSNNFFVTNCDILIDVNFENIIEQHLISKCDLTIVSSFKSFEIPYGVFKISKKGNLLNFEEKPSFNHLVNCGVYLMNKKLIRYIPKQKACDIDELIKILIKNKKKIKVYPIPDYAWQDFGAWKEYFKNI
tara:strand:- start:4480 stop:5517 length:1038 start_codon:yes stop_codon:yes gene_type:complete